MLHNNVISASVHNCEIYIGINYLFFSCYLFERIGIEGKAKVRCFLEETLTGRNAKGGKASGWLMADFKDAAKRVSQLCSGEGPCSGPCKSPYSQREEAE